MELSFGEQIKILLNRNHMTIQDLANRYEAATGTKMSRQNLTQRLKRDNFPEQDMHILASLLGCRVSIQVDPIASAPAADYSWSASAEPVPAMQTQIQSKPPIQPERIPDIPEPDKSENLPIEIPEIFQKNEPEGDINPLTGSEYLTNTVRRHPEKPGYIQVYDQTIHSWSDVQENYFWEFQQRKKQMLGSDYQEPLVI